MRDLAAAAFVSGLLFSSASIAGGAHAAELVPSLPCAFASGTMGDGAEAFCISIHNTCNTPLTATVKDEETGVEQITPPMPAGEIGKACGGHRQRLLGYTLVGP